LDRIFAIAAAAIVALPALVAAPLPALAQPRANAPATGFGDLAEKLLPAVGNISTTQTV
jgi:hypothetical protein